MRLMNGAQIGPVNLNPDEYTILELAGAVQKLVNPKAGKFEPLPQDDPRRRRPDITRAKLAKLATNSSLTTGLKLTEDFRARINSEQFSHKWDVCSQLDCKP